MNRNFGFHWNEGGSSAVPCSDTYHGGAAFSEVESQIVRDTVLSVAAQTKVYLTIHSYGQYWLTPWGYTSDLPVDYDQLVSTSFKYPTKSQSIIHYARFHLVLYELSTVWLFALLIN